MKKAIFMIGLFLIPIQVNARTYINMGECKITAYCPCKICSDNWGHQTFSGKTARSNHTVAIDRTVFDIGSKIKIGDTIYVAEDVGGKVKGDHVDIFFDTHEEVEAFADGKGIEYKNVWVIRDNKEEK